MKYVPNVFEAVVNTMKTFVDDEPKAPLHIGEAMICWLYLATINEGNTFVQSALNTTTDDEVIEMLNDAQKMCKSQISRLETFMKNEGVQLPDVTQEKPKSEPSDVPLGVKMTDDEITNGVSVKLASANVACANAQSQSIRNDFAIMFVQFQAEQLTFSATLKTLMRKRGWIKVPPYYYPPGLPNNN